MNFYYYRHLRCIEEGHHHMLIHGSSTSGKKTLATRLVQSQLKYDMKSCPFNHEFFRVETSNNKVSELNTWMRKGKFHIELDFYNTQVSYDVHIVSHILKMLEYGTIGDDGKLQRVYIMLFHFDKASMETQYMLRRCIEKMRFVTFVITARNSCKLIESLKSRFYCIRLPKITNDEKKFEIKIEIYDTVLDTIIHARKRIYEALLMGIEPIDILKGVYHVFLKSGCYDTHQLIHIFSKKDVEMVNSTKPIYHIEHAIYQTLTIERLEK
jgi:hypothetical protein